MPLIIVYTVRGGLVPSDLVPSELVPSDLVPSDLVRILAWMTMAILQKFDFPKLGRSLGSMSR